MKKKKYRWSLIICAAAFVLMLVYLFVFNEGEQLLRAVTSIRPEYFILMILCMLAFWLLETLCTYLLLRKVGARQNLGQTFTITMIGQYYNCVTPLSSGGQPMQAYYMTRYGTKVSSSMTALLARLIVYEFTLTLYSAVVLVWKLDFFLGTANGVLVTLAIIGFALNAVGIVLFLMLAVWKSGTLKLAHLGIRLLHKIRIIKNEEAAVRKTDAQLCDAYENMRFLRKRPLTVLAIFGITVVQLTILYGISFVIYRGFSGMEPAAFTQDAFTVISCQAMVSMVSAMFPLPGAVGLTETSYAIYFRSIYPENCGACVDMSMIIWRFMTFYLCIIIGIVITLVLDHRRRPDTALPDDGDTPDAPDAPACAAAKIAAGSAEIAAEPGTDAPADAPADASAEDEKRP